MHLNENYKEPMKEEINVKNEKRYSEKTINVCSANSNTLPTVRAWSIVSSPFSNARQF